MKRTVVFMGLVVLLVTQLGLAHQGICSQLMTVATPTAVSHCAHEPETEPVQAGCDEEGCRQLCRSASSLIPAPAKKFAFEPVLDAIAVSLNLRPAWEGELVSTPVLDASGPPGPPRAVFLLNESFLF